MNSERSIFKNSTAPGESVVSNMTPSATNLSLKQTGPDSRLAMNAEKMPGKHFGRPSHPTDSPDGKVEAIVMSDSAVDIQEGIARNPGYMTPDHVYAWEYSTSWTADSTGTSVPLNINPRILAYRDFFYYWHSQMLVKLVCKMPLDRSDRFYLNWSDRNVGTISTSGVGFEWAPIEKNEIYVLLPWSAIYPMADPSIAVSDIFGYLNITQIGSNGQPVIVDIYTCPVDQKLYNLKPITPPAAAALYEVPKNTTFTVANSAQIFATHDSTSSDFTIQLDGVDLFVKTGATVVSLLTTISAGDHETSGVSPTAKVYSTVPPIAYLTGAEEQIDNKLELPGSTDEDAQTQDQTGHTPDLKPEELTTKVFGENKTEAVRETNQRFLIGSAEVDGKDATEVTFNFPEELLINFARHRLWTKYLSLKLVATQTIQNPARYRIVQLPQFGSYSFTGGQYFEMPGVEWDPKDGDLDLSFYWDRPDAAFFYDDLQTLQQNIVSFLPRLVIQPINNYGNAVPINVFASLDHSSYSAVKELTTSTATQQIRFDGLKHCCANSCSLVMKRFGGLNCERCNSDKECKCHCLTFQQSNLNVHGYHFAPYIKSTDENLIVHTYFDDEIDENRVIMAIKYRGAKYVEQGFLGDDIRSDHAKAVLRECLVAINCAIHKDIMERYGKLYVHKVLDHPLHYVWEYELIPKPEESTAEEQIYTGTSKADSPIPGDQFQTLLTPLPSDEASTNIARTYAFVDTFELDVTDADPTPSVVIPIDANTLGPYVRQEARRHRNWRGNLHFRILFNTPRTVAGAATVAHLDIEPASQPSQYALRQYPHQTTMDNSPVDLTCGWRRQNPWLARDGNNGYLYITFNGASFGTTANTVKVTIYVDASGIEFSRPTPLAALPPSRLSMVPNRSDKPLKDVSMRAVELSLSDIGNSSGFIQDSDRVAMYEGGLFFNGYAMECPTCHLILGDWEEGDVPLNEHYRHSGAEQTQCALVKQRLQSGFPRRPLSNSGRTALNSTLARHQVREAFRSGRIQYD